MPLENCVFHAVPETTSAVTELLPLSARRESDPEGYRRALAKYDDTPARQRLRETWIPGVEAAWTEVVFLSPTHPHAIWRAWREIAGLELPPMSFWAIPVGDVPSPVLLDRQLSSTGEPIDPREVTDLDPATYRAARDTPDRHRQWITDLTAAGKQGAWFHGIPHVLSRGPVPLTRARIVEWQHEGW